MQWGSCCGWIQDDSGFFVRLSSVWCGGQIFLSGLRRLTRERSQALAEMQGHLHERIQGISVIRAFNLEKHEQGQFDKQNRHYLGKALAHSRWNAHTFAIVNTITDISPILVIAFAGYQVIQGN